MKKWFEALGQDDVHNLTYVGVDACNFEITMNMRTIDLVRKLFDFWKGLQEPDLALKKEVLKMFLPIANPNPEDVHGDFEDNGEFKWLSVAQPERGRVLCDVVWEDDENELRMS
jgi:hypothetical protein